MLHNCLCGNHFPVGGRVLQAWLSRTFQPHRYVHSTIGTLSRFAAFTPSLASYPPLRAHTHPASYALFARPPLLRAVERDYSLNVSIVSPLWEANRLSVRVSETSRSKRHPPSCRHPPRRLRVRVSSLPLGGESVFIIRSCRSKFTKIFRADLRPNHLSCPVFEHIR